VFGNRLLEKFDIATLAALSPLSEVELAIGAVLAHPGDTLEHIYFPTGALISLITIMEDGRSVESHLVGRADAFGLITSLAGGISQTHALVQVAGSAVRVDAGRLRAAARHHPLIGHIAIEYSYAVTAQLQQAAACNTLHTVVQRLCRWLLICQDKLGGDMLPLTQESLAAMLGVQRTSVSAVATELQRQGLIRYSRGRIGVLDRGAIRTLSCECYQATRHFSAPSVSERLSEAG
jgi:CRP-like cAMP-binding protein